MGSLEASGTWSPEQRKLHLNVKELLAIHLGLKHFVEVVTNRTMVIHLENTTALSYIKKQGGTHLFSLCEVARELLIWADQKQVRIITRFIQGRMNVQADELS